MVEYVHYLRTGKARSHPHDFAARYSEYLPDAALFNRYLSFTSRLLSNKEVLLLIAKQFDVNYDHEYYTNIMSATG